MRRLASVCPLAGVADSLQGKFTPLLISARLYLSPRLYSRFSMSLIFYPAIGEVLALFLPEPQGVLVIASLGVVQIVPILLPATLAYARRRAVEAELPFFLIALSIFSRASSPAIDDGLKRLAALGDGVFPELSKEQAILERDLTFVPGSPDKVVEAALGVNPSRRLREFAHSFMITLTTGKSITEYVEEEAARQVEILEARWKGFSESVGSLAEVSLMVLALFPVGLDMRGAAVPGVATTQILTLSLGLLTVFSVALLALMDSAQPVLHNSTPGPTSLLLILASWSASTYLYLLGAIPITGSLVITLLVSTVG